MDAGRILYAKSDRKVERAGSGALIPRHGRKIVVKDQSLGNLNARGITSGTAKEICEHLSSGQFPPVQGHLKNGSLPGWSSVPFASQVHIKL